MHWYDNPTVLGSLPPLYRASAFACRLTRFLPGRRVRGEHRLLGWTMNAARRLRVTDRAKVRFPDKTMWVDLQDGRMIAVLEEAAGTNEESALLARLLKPGDTFLDIGANHGTYALTAASLVGHKGRVIAFEPQPRLATLLQASAASNGWPHVSVHQVALSDCQGEVPLWVPRFWSGKAGIYQAFSGGDDAARLTVPMTTLDQILKDQPLPGTLLIKMDVEGHEVLLLRGATETLSRHRPLILFEMNADSLKAAGQSPASLLQTLESLGYTTFSEVAANAPRESAGQVRLLETGMRNLLAYPANTPG